MYDRNAVRILLCYRAIILRRMSCRRIVENPHCPLQWQVPIHPWTESSRQDLILGVLTGKCSFDELVGESKWQIITSTTMMTQL